MNNLGVTHSICKSHFNPYQAMDTTTGNGSWSEVTQTATGNENKIRCDGLKPLHKYRFRVKAVNKIGISDPGEMKGPDILMKDPWGKYNTQNN